MNSIDKIVLGRACKSGLGESESKFDLGFFFYKLRLWLE